MEPSSEKIEGFLAYFDVLGFSDIIEKGDFSEYFYRFCTIIESAVSPYSHKMSYKFFSDSVVIYTDRIDEDTFYELVSVLSRIFFLFVVNMKLSLCGSVSCGSFSIHKSNGNVMIAGLPMVDAVRNQQQQDWIGIMITPEVVKKLDFFKFFLGFNLNQANLPRIRKNLNIWWYTYITKYDKIPMKTSENSDTTINGFVIIPRRSISDEFNKILLDLRLFRGILGHMKYTVSKSNVQNKYNKTLEMLDYLIPLFQGVRRNKIEEP